MEQKQFKKYFLDAILINSYSEETRDAFEEYVDHDNLFKHLSTSFNKFINDLQLTELSDVESEVLIYFYIEKVARIILQEANMYDLEEMYEKYNVKKKNPLPIIITIFINPLFSSKKKYHSLIEKAEFEYRFLFRLFYEKGSEKNIRDELSKLASKELTRRKIIKAKLKTKPMHFDLWIEAIDLMERTGMKFNTALNKIANLKKLKDGTINSIKTSFPSWSKKQIMENGSFRDHAERFLKLHNPEWLNSHLKK